MLSIHKLKKRRHQVRTEDYSPHFFSQLNYSSDWRKSLIIIFHCVCTNHWLYFSKGCLILCLLYTLMSPPLMFMHIFAQSLFLKWQNKNLTWYLIATDRCRSNKKLQSSCSKYLQSFLFTHPAATALSLIRSQVWTAGALKSTAFLWALFWATTTNMNQVGVDNVALTWGKFLSQG